MVIATVKRSARDAGTAVPIGPLTRRALEGFGVRTLPTPRPAPARGLTADECATVLGADWYEGRHTTRNRQRTSDHARPRKADAIPEIHPIREEPRS